MPDSDSRITRIQTFHLMCPVPDVLSSAQARILRRDAVLVRIESGSGAAGWGECSGFPDMVQTALVSVLGPQAIGRSALAPDTLWHDLWRSIQPWGRRGTTVGALSGLDMALWDLRGKLTGQSVSQMMGGAFRDRVPCAATGLHFREVPETELIPQLVEEAHGYAERGFRAVRAQIGRNTNFDTALVRSLRRALPHLPLHADAARSYDLPEAVRMGRLLSELNFSSFDEPFSQETPHLYPLLTAQVSIPLASGQFEQTRWGFQSLLTPGGGISLAQLDVAFCGGLTEALRIRAVAGALGINITPHCEGTQLGLAASLHLMATDFRQPGRMEPATGLISVDSTPNPLREAIFSESISIEGGIAQVPVSPGLGVAIDSKDLKFFCIRECEIHV